MSYEQALKQSYAEVRGRLGVPLAVPARLGSFTAIPEPITAPLEAIEAPTVPETFVVKTCVDVTDEAAPPPPVFNGAKWKAILREVAYKHNLIIDAMLGPRRDMATVYARQEYAYRLREECGLSWAQIGLRLGNKDHTTALHSYKRHAEFLASGERKYKYNGFKPGNFWTDAKVLEAVTLRASGLKMQEIADAIGARSASSVSARIRQDEDARIEDRVNRVIAAVKSRQHTMVKKALTQGAETLSP